MIEDFKTPFKNPIEPRERKSSEWFAAPTKEGATTGRFPGQMTACGDNYGVGFNQPVGKEKASNVSSGPLSVKTQCFRCDPKV